MLIACSFSSKGVYRPLNGTEQLTKDSQHAPPPTLPLSLYFLLGQAVAHPRMLLLKKHAESKKNSVALWFQSSYLFWSIRVEIASCASVDLMVTKVLFLLLEWTLLLDSEGVSVDIYPQHTVPRFSCNICPYLIVVQVNNERELSAFVSIVVPVMHNPPFSHFAHTQEDCTKVKCNS